MAILLKEGIGLTSGFVREKDKAIIPSSEIIIRTDKDTPVILDEVEIQKVIGATVSKSKVEILGTPNIDNMRSNGATLFITNNAQQAHTTYDVVDIKYSGADLKYQGVVESYILTPDGTYLKATREIEIIDDLEAQYTSLQNKINLKANESDVVKKDGSVEMNAGYQASSPQAVAVKQDVDNVSTTLQQEIDSSNARITNLEKNPAARYKSAVRKWVGVLDPTTTTTDSIIFHVDTISPEDGGQFDYSANQDMNIWLKDDNGVDSFLFAFDVKVSTIPQMIEIVREQGGNNVIALFAQLSAGRLTISRNANTNFELSNLKVVEAKQDVFALADNLVNKNELTAYQKTNAPSLETSSKNIIGAINEVKRATNGIGNKQDKVGLGVVNANGANEVFVENGFYSSKDTGGNRQVATQEDHLIDKGFGDSHYASKVFDYSDQEQPLVYNLTGGNRYQMITVPNGENAPQGTEIKLVPIVNTSDPNQLPQDTDQITYGVNKIWINKATTDIMSWSEIKTKVNAKSTMVIRQILPDEYELLRWEDPVSTGGSAKVKKYIQGGSITEVVVRMRAILQKGIMILFDDTVDVTEVVVSVGYNPFVGGARIISGEKQLKGDKHIIQDNQYYYWE